MYSFFISPAISLAHELEFFVGFKKELQFMSVVEPAIGC
jgi:hypothetical protein